MKAVASLGRRAFASRVNGATACCRLQHPFGSAARALSTAITEKDKLIIFGEWYLVDVYYIYICIYIVYIVRSALCSDILAYDLLRL